MDNIEFQINNPSEMDQTNENTITALINQAISSFTFARNARDSRSCDMHKIALKNILAKLVPMIFPNATPLKIHKLKNYGADLLRNPFWYRELPSLSAAREKAFKTFLNGKTPEIDSAEYYAGYFDDDTFVNDKDKENLPPHITLAIIPSESPLPPEPTKQTSYISDSPTCPPSPTASTSSGITASPICLSLPTVSAPSAITASPICLSSPTASAPPDIENFDTMCHVEHCSQSGDPLQTTRQDDTNYANLNCSTWHILSERFAVPEQTTPAKPASSPTPLTSAYPPNESFDKMCHVEHFENAPPQMCHVEHFENEPTQTTMCHVEHFENEPTQTTMCHVEHFENKPPQMCHVEHFENGNCDNSLDNELCNMPQFDMATSKGLGKGLGALISMFDEDMEELKSHESSTKTTIIKDTQTKTVQTENVPRGTLPSSGVTMTAGTINIDKLGAIEIDVNLIDNNLAQPRRSFDPEEMRELEQSILTHGVLQPILLNRVGTRYMIVAGERRWRASKNVGLRTIPALVRNYTPRQIAEIALVENLIRSDLNEIETAQGVKRLMDNHSLTQEQVSNILAKSRSTISHSLRLLTLPNEVQQLLQQKKISMGHAKILITITDKSRVVSLANKCAQGMSVRELETITSDDNRKTTTQKYTKPQSTELKQLTRDISELLGTRTIIQGTESQGKLTIEYHNKSELNRILDILKKGLLR